MYKHLMASNLELVRTKVISSMKRSLNLQQHDYYVVSITKSKNSQQLSEKFTYPEPGPKYQPALIVLFKIRSMWNGQISFRCRLGVSVRQLFFSFNFTID